MFFQGCTSQNGEISQSFLLESFSWFSLSRHHWSFSHFCFTLSSIPIELLFDCFLCVFDFLQIFFFFFLFAAGGNNIWINVFRFNFWFMFNMKILFSFSNDPTAIVQYDTIVSCESLS